MNLTDLSLSEAAALLQQRAISPVELTRACLERIQQLNPQLNCFITLTAETALQAAHQAEVEIARGAARSPLHGIPLALKDLYTTADAPTTAGSKFTLTQTPFPGGEGSGMREATAAQKLRAAGAVLLGKLNMHEIALGVTNENPHFGDCHNPWDIRCITGGSSGGSAAALAAGLIFGSLGSDTGGSIRIPSSLCGTVGLKPTYGRVSLQGVIPLSWHCDHAGPMARRVRDVALLLQAIAGYDAGDPYSVNTPVDDYISTLDAGVLGWRVALAADPYFTGADQEVLSAVQAAAEVFSQLGAHVERVEIPNGYEAAQANGAIVTADASVFHRERMETHPENFGTDVLERLRSGMARIPTDYIPARRTQAQVRRWFERFFDNYDILLTPTTAVTAPRIGDESAVAQARSLTRFTAPFNLTGLPALSLPCGFTLSGLPIGVQLVARPWAEAAVLRAAFAYEQATEWHIRRPFLNV